MTNHYARAIYHDDPDERLKSFHKFLQEEMERELAELDEYLDDEGEIEDSGQWGYHKGRLDGIRTIHSMVVQTRLQVGHFDPEE